MGDELIADVGAVGEAGARDGPALERALRHALLDVGAYSRGLLPDHALRPYQVEVARAIADSVRHRRGLQFAVVFARQAGKDETLVQRGRSVPTVFAALWHAFPAKKPGGYLRRAVLVGQAANS